MRETLLALARSYGCTAVLKRSTKRAKQGLGGTAMDGMRAWESKPPVHKSRSLKEIMDEQGTSDSFLPQKQQQQEKSPEGSVAPAFEAVVPTTQEDEDEVLAKALQAIEQEDLLTSQLQHVRDLEAAKSNGTEKIQVKYIDGPLPSVSSSTNGLMAYTKRVESLEKELVKQRKF